MALQTSTGGILQGNRHERRRSLSKVAWTKKQWAEDTGLGLTTIHNLINAKRIVKINVGKRALILTSPEDFISAQRDA